MKVYASVWNSFSTCSPDLMIVRVLNEKNNITFFERKLLTQEVFNECAEYKISPLCLPYVVGHINERKHLILGFDYEFEDKGIIPEFKYTGDKHKGCEK